MKTPSWFLKKNFAACALLPLSWLYFLGSRVVYCIRSSVVSHRSSVIGRRSSVPKTICIGGLLAGGVGKTPIVREIAKRLSAPVVMRGYKGGDEAEMLKKNGLDVYVGNRAKNIEKLNRVPRPAKHPRAPGITPIILDDGFQNPSLPKDISILVFDEKIGVGNGFMLPAGPLREPMSAVKRADAIIVIRNQESGINQFTKMIKMYRKPMFFANNKTLIPDSLKLIPLIAFAGIGYPQKFFDGLPVKPVKTIGFPDHYQYTDEDLQRLFKLAKDENARLITTEKDWVRLPAAAQKKIQFAPLTTTIEPAFWKWLDKAVSNH
jgi:tetraacyldisaccharide 4'-kinase